MREQVARGQIRTPDQRLRIFISSTLGELAEERQAARAAVEQLRLAPVMFELGARPHPPRALYRSYLEQSDVFVGIYWQRYGWVAPDMAISGLEDEYVLSEGMPRLVYVKRPATEMEPRLGELLDTVQSEDTTSYKPFRDADELGSLILDDLALMLTERFDTADTAPAPVAAAPANNLPSPTSELVGREALLTQLHDVLARAEARLVTLTGPGGTGKTRLGLQVAWDQVGRFADGVYFVDLSSVGGEEGVFSAIAATLDVHPSGGATPLEALQDHLHDAEMLLLLDNFEHLTAAATGIVALLERCPKLTVLVTSQRALRVRGERLVPVPPLSLPGAERGASPSAALESEAVRLFVQRAISMDPGFEITDANAADVVAICARLDGLPLAIELAAARVNVLGLAELRERLDDRLDVLKSGTQDLPERQRTIRNTIEWSTDLLTATERGVFELFSVFAGGRLADLELVASAVPGFDGGVVVEALGSLVDRSLVRGAPGADGRPRFTMLQTIQAYASEQLHTKPDGADAVRRAHAAHYTSRAIDLARLTGRDRAQVLAEFADDVGNMRTAWRFWVEREDVTHINDMLEPLWGYFDLCGDYRSAVDLGNDLLGVLSSQAPTPERVRDKIAVEMSLARTLMAVQGFTEETEEAYRSLLERTGPASDPRERFVSLRCLATLHMLLRSDFAGAAGVAEELLAIAEAEQDSYLLSEAHLIAGVTKTWLLSLDESVIEVCKAVEYLDATEPGFVKFRVGPNVAVVSTVVSGLLSWMTGFPDRAVTEVSRALATARELDHPYSTAYALWHAGLLDLWRLDLDGLADRSEALREVADAHGYPVWRALGLVLQGIASVVRGETESGLAVLEEGFTLYQGLSAPPMFWPALLMMRGTAVAAAGRLDEGLGLLEEAERIVQDEDPLRADMALAHGVLLLAAPGAGTEQAETHFERAAALAAAIGARMVQLEAATRLATIRRGTAREAEARDELRDILETFTEGFTTPQLIAARAALDL